MNAVYNFECHEGKKGRKALIIPAGDAVPKLPTGGTEGRRSGNAELESLGSSAIPPPVSIFCRTDRQSERERERAGCTSAALEVHSRS